LKTERYKPNNRSLSFESLVGNVEMSQILRSAGVVAGALLLGVPAVMAVSIVLPLASPGPFSPVIGAIEEYGGLALVIAVPGAFYIARKLVGGDNF
jgi:hypothetical protein